MPRRTPELRVLEAGYRAERRARIVAGEGFGESTAFDLLFGGYTAQINYAALTSEHCWTGTAPYGE